ncbi:MAG: hypothetical protein MHM6MM_002827 [Cercozoa sp. M6MM]
MAWLLLRLICFFSLVRADTPYAPWLDPIERFFSGHNERCDQPQFGVILGAEATQSFCENALVCVKAPEDTIGEDYPAYMCEAPHGAALFRSESAAKPSQQLHWQLIAPEKPLKCESNIVTNDRHIGSTSVARSKLETEGCEYRKGLALVAPMENHPWFDALTLQSVLSEVSEYYSLSPSDLQEATWVDVRHLTPHDWYRVNTTAEARGHSDGAIADWYRSHVRTVMSDSKAQCIHFDRVIFLPSWKWSPTWHRRNEWHSQCFPKRSLLNLADRTLRAETVSSRPRHTTISDRSLTLKPALRLLIATREGEKHRVLQNRDEVIDATVALFDRSGCEKRQFTISDFDRDGDTAVTWQCQLDCVDVHVCVTALALRTESWSQQLRRVRWTNLFAGVHGAGLTWTLWLAQRVHQAWQFEWTISGRHNFEWMAHVAKVPRLTAPYPCDARDICAVDLDDYKSALRPAMCDLMYHGKRLSRWHCLHPVLLPTVLIAAAVAAAAAVAVRWRRRRRGDNQLYSPVPP